MGGFQQNSRRRQRTFDCTNVVVKFFTTIIHAQKQIATGNTTQESALWKEDNKEENINQNGYSLLWGGLLTQTQSPICQHQTSFVFVQHCNLIPKNRLLLRIGNQSQGDTLLLFFRLHKVVFASAFFPGGTDDKQRLPHFKKIIISNAQDLLGTTL